jgi:low affinity Fe/Cu permease
MEVLPTEIWVGIAGIISSIVAFLQGKRKTNAEIDSIIVQSVTAVTSEFKDIIALQKEDIKTIREHRDDCEGRIKRIETEINKMKAQCKNGCYS